MIIKALPSGPFATNAYIIGCPQTKQALIIDPGVESGVAIVSTLKKEGLTPIQIVLTHSHWDHIGDVALLKEQLHIPVAIHSLDAYNLIAPGSDNLPCWMNIRGATPDLLLAEGDSVTCGNLSFVVIHTPGHTPGGICLYNEKEKILISGDTLFKDSMGNISFPTAQPELMWTSLEKLAQLPSETQVFPGHGPSTTIEDEQSWLSRARERFGVD